MRLLPFEAFYPNKDLISSPELFFGEVSNQYTDFKKAGFFKKVDQRGLYVYEISNPLNRHRGLIGSHDIADFEEEKILGHENTIAEREQQIMQLMMLRKAMIKPVLLTHEPIKEIHALLENYIEYKTPFLSLYLEEEKEYHKVWSIDTDGDIQTIINLYRDKLDTLYIADGHHRSSTTIRLLKNHHLLGKTPESSAILSCYFSFDQLKIYDYNRVVDVFSNISPATFIALLSNYATIKPIKTKRKPSKKFEITMYIQKEWYVVKWKKKYIEAELKSNKIILDTTLINHWVMEKILNIGDVRTTKLVQYFEGKSGLDSLIKEVNKNKNLVGICIYPVDIQEVVAFSNAGISLPPKSTWFEPRIKNGLLVKEIDE
ncbi:MAG: DUF1015 domain-containing protein [Saprospiraceae bacterium]